MAFDSTWAITNVIEGNVKCAGFAGLVHGIVAISAGVGWVLLVTGAAICAQHEMILQIHTSVGIAV